MASPHKHNRYSDSNIHTMESVYGTGFLSPGGAEEVAQIVADLPVEGAEVLDLGCGLGGASIALVRDHAAAHVTGVDIEPAVLARAATLVAESGLSDRVTLRETTPGPLPFENARFDVVYASAVTCHIENLPPFFAEIRRVLRRGGSFTGGEWFIGRNVSAYSQWDDMLREKGAQLLLRAVGEVRRRAPQRPVSTPQRSRTEAMPSPRCARGFSSGFVASFARSFSPPSGRPATKHSRAGRRPGTWRWPGGGALYRHFAGPKSRPPPAPDSTMSRSCRATPHGTTPGRPVLDADPLEE